MEIIAKISKGSKMDQIYISKERVGFDIGNYVIIKPIEAEKRKALQKIYFYNAKDIEPIKVEIIKRIISFIDKNIKNENIIITGSFLDKGFNFNDIDLIIITNLIDNKLNKEKIKNTEEFIKSKTGLKLHVLLLNNKSLAEGISTDPLYQAMLSKCIAKKRFVYRVKEKIDYKLLDLHLLKSKLLADNFDTLNGHEKYYHIRNVVSIYLYTKNKRITKEIVDNKIKEIFSLKSINEIKQNMLDKQEFLNKYKFIYKKTFDKILKGIKNASK